MESEVYIAYYTPYFPADCLNTFFFHQHLNSYVNYYLLSSSFNLHSLLSVLVPSRFLPFPVFYICSSSLPLHRIFFPKFSYPFYADQFNLLTYSGFLQFESPPITMLSITRDLHFSKLVARDCKL